MARRLSGGAEQRPSTAKTPAKTGVLAVAEGQGFEPWGQAKPAQRISSAPPSTAQPSLHKLNERHDSLVSIRWQGCCSAAKIKVGVGCTAEINTRTAIQRARFRLHRFPAARVRYPQLPHSSDRSCPGHRRPALSVSGSAAPLAIRDARPGRSAARLWTSCAGTPRCRLLPRND